MLSSIRNDQLDKTPKGPFKTFLALNIPQRKYITQNLTRQIDDIQSKEQEITNVHHVGFKTHENITIKKIPPKSDLFLGVYHKLYDK